METEFGKVQQLSRLENVSIEKATCKLFEECGELAQAVNMTIGMKNTNMSKEEILNQTAEECADVIQNVFAIADKLGITYETLCIMLERKNLKYHKRILERTV